MTFRSVDTSFEYYRDFFPICWGCFFLVRAINGCFGRWLMNVFTELLIIFYAEKYLNCIKYQSLKKFLTVIN